MRPSVAMTDATSRAEFQRQIDRLPVTMRPALNQQLGNWENLFPYEQARYVKFMRGLSALSDAELHALTDPLITLETKMGVAAWNYSVVTDTMENASLLARSPYYGEWRRQVQNVFAGIESAAATPANAPRGRVVLLVLPDSLPIMQIVAARPWDDRGVEVRVEGDARRICELALKDETGLPARLRADGAESADCWLIDADAKLGALRGENTQPASLLEYAALKRFREARRSGALESQDACAADAFAEAVLGDPAEAARSDYTVHVVIEHEALARGHALPGETCEIPGVGPVNVEWVRELLGSAFVTAIVKKGKDIATVAHFGRHIPVELRTAMIVSGSPSGSVSLASTSIVTGVLTAVSAASGAGTGGWFGAAFTLTVTVAVALPPRPSSIV